MQFKTRNSQFNTVPSVQPTPVAFEYPSIETDVIKISPFKWELRTARCLMDSSSAFNSYSENRSGPPRGSLSEMGRKTTAKRFRYLNTTTNRSLYSCSPVLSTAEEMHPPMSRRNCPQSHLPCTSGFITISHRQSVQIWVADEGTDFQP